MILNKTFKVNAMTLLIQGRIYRLIWFFATLFIIATVIKFIGSKDCCLLAVFLSIPCFIICDFATKRSAFLFKNIGNSTLLIRAPYFNPHLLKTLYNFLMRVPIPIPFTDRNNRYIRLYGAQKGVIDDVLLP